MDAIMPAAFHHTTPLPRHCVYNKSSSGAAYTVALTNGDEVRVVIESGHIQTGDCVAVEQGHSANIRRVTSAHCESGAQVARSEPIVHASLQHDAAECHAVKEMALQAETEEQIDVAIKKIRMFCEH